MPQASRQAIHLVLVCHHDIRLLTQLRQAGSGKSTLMNFVSDEEQTREILESWAPPWIYVSPHTTSGDEMYRCQIGLPKSLLFQAFRYSHSLVDILGLGLVAADLWATAELVAAFGRLSRWCATSFETCATKIRTTNSCLG